MSLLSAAALFDVMNNEDEFPFSENYNVCCLGLSHQAVRSVSAGLYSHPIYKDTAQIHTLLTETEKYMQLLWPYATKSSKQWLFQGWYIQCHSMEPIAKHGVVVGSSW